MPRALQPVRGRESGDAVDPFGGEHPPRGARPVDLGHAETADRRATLRAISAIAAASMRRSISSLTDCAERCDRRDRPQAPSLRRCTRSRNARREEEGVEIAAKRCSMPGRRIFTATSRPVADRRGPVHLRDRCRGDRRAEFGEQRFDRHAEIGGDRRPRFVHGEGRQAVLQRPQFRRPRSRR